MSDNQEPRVGIGGDPDLSTPASAISGFARLVSGRIKLWEDARFVLVDLPLDHERASAILPRGMCLAEPARATLFIADYTRTSFTVPYKEAALLIHVRTLFGRGVHCAWMVVDDDTALIYGREVLGYPKKLARLAFKQSAKGVKASVKRRGVQVVTIDASKGAAESNPAPIMGHKTFNVGAMGQAVAFNPVWLFQPREVIHESYVAQASVTLEQSAHDPLAQLVSGPPLAARIAAIDIIGAAYMFPVGLTGLRWFTRTSAMRYR